jgi:Polysulphide reductase, NrfD
MDREERLDQLKREAERTGTVTASGVRPAGAPFPIADAERGYYGLPLLKRPTWTWEAPAYLFVGGAAGAAALIGAAASLAGHPTLARDARWIAAAGAAASAPLLIADLGRPDRFINMLRVFKVQSPMSMGVWTLVAFATASSSAAFADAASRLLPAGTPIRAVRDASQLVAASTGMAMATYPGVLVGATAIPVWSSNVRLLPIHFGASSLGCAASMLELSGHRQRALHWLALSAAAIETAVVVRIECGTDRAGEPLRRGGSGALVGAAGLLAGPVPLVLRLIGGRSAGLRKAAAICAVAGSALSRFGWIKAGTQSADDPAAVL